MSTLKALKTRIQSVQSTRKITSAMYMVAAAKFRRAQKGWEAGEGYANALLSTLRSLPSYVFQETENPLISNNNTGPVIAILFSADRGLCGGFNNQLFRKSKEYFESLKAKHTNFFIFTIGKKAHDFAKKLYPTHLKSSGPRLLHEATYESIQAHISEIEACFRNENASKCVVLFNQYASPLQQVPSCNVILPLSETFNDNINTTPRINTHLPYFTPSESLFLDYFLPQYLQGTLWSVIKQTTVGEYAARMAAMDSSTKSCDDVLHDLKLQYNQTRQARITSELIEIISGAEALQKG